MAESNHETSFNREYVRFVRYLVGFSQEMNRFKLELFVLSGWRDCLRGEGVGGLCHLLHVYQLLYQSQPGYHELATSRCQIFVFWGLSLVGGV